MPVHISHATRAFIFFCYESQGMAISRETRASAVDLVSVVTEHYTPDAQVVPGDEPGTMLVSWDVGGATVALRFGPGARECLWYVGPTGAMVRTWEAAHLDQESLEQRTGVVAQIKEAVAEITEASLALKGEAERGMGEQP